MESDANIVRRGETGMPNVVIPMAVGIGVAAASMGLAVAVNGDAHVLSFFTSHRPTWLVDTAKGVTMVGDVTVLAPLALLAGVVLWRRRAGLVMAFAPLFAFLAAGFVAAVGKSVIGRSRPPLAWRLVTETEPSMPSGHTTEGTTFYIALAIVLVIVLRSRATGGRVLAAGAVVLSVAIGLSRLELGVHWPTDVTVSWLLGASIAVATVAVATAVDKKWPSLGSGRLESSMGERRRAEQAVGDETGSDDDDHDATPAGNRQKS